MTGTRKVIAKLPVGAYNIQFWFNYKSMPQNFLGKEILWFSPIKTKNIRLCMLKKSFKNVDYSLDTIIIATAMITNVYIYSYRCQ